MLFSSSDLLWATLSLSFSSILPPHFPQWGSPLTQGLDAWFPLARLCSIAPPHLFTFLCPYLEISRPPLLPLCRVQTLSPSQQKRKLGQLHLPLTIICWVKAMSTLMRLHCLFSSSPAVLLETGIALYCYLAGTEKVRDFPLDSNRCSGGCGRRIDRYDDDRGDREK